MRSLEEKCLLGLTLLSFAVSKYHYIILPLDLNIRKKVYMYLSEFRPSTSTFSAYILVQSLQF